LTSADTSTPASRRSVFWKRRVHEGLAPLSDGFPWLPIPHSTALAAAAPAHFLPVPIVDPDAGARLEIVLTNA
jgi:hypothetical protein